MSRVCVFGDSIVWGSWDPEGGGWVGRLQKAGCNRVDLSNPPAGTFTEVYNCGVPGDTVAEVLARFDVEARARVPAAIVLAVGINDVPHPGYAGTPADLFRTRYVTLVAKARALVGDVVLVTPTNVDEAGGTHGYRNADIEVLAACVRECAARFGLPLVDVFGLLTPADLEPDGLHPGAAGHLKLLHAVQPVVFGLPALNGPDVAAVRAD